MGLQARAPHIWAPIHLSGDSSVGLLLEVHLHLCLIEFSSF